MLKWLIAATMVCASATAAQSQVQCYSDFTAGLSTTCGVAYAPRGDSVCDSEAEAIEAINWVLFKDSGALGTYREAVKACRYDGAGYIGTEGALFAILHAQKHNSGAMCNLFSCANEVTFNIGAYLQKLQTEGKLPLGN